MGCEIKSKTEWNKGAVLFAEEEEDGDLKVAMPISEITVTQFDSVKKIKTVIGFVKRVWIVIVLRNN